jgi:hypothetical protein
MKEAIEFSDGVHDSKACGGNCAAFAAEWMQQHRCTARRPFAGESVAVMNMLQPV